MVLIYLFLEKTNFLLSDTERCGRKPNKCRHFLSSIGCALRTSLKVSEGKFLKKSHVVACNRQTTFQVEFFLQTWVSRWCSIDVDDCIGC